MSPPQPSSVKRRRISNDRGTSVSFSQTVSVMDNSGDIAARDLQCDSDSDDDMLFVDQKKDVGYRAPEDLLRKYIRREEKNRVASVLFKNVTFDLPYHTVFYENCTNLHFDFKLKFLEGMGPSGRGDMKKRNLKEFISYFDPMRYLVFDTKGMNRVLTCEDIWSLEQDILLKFNGVTFLKVNREIGAQEENGKKECVRPDSELVLNYIRDSCKILSNKKLKVSKLAVSNCEFSVKLLKVRCRNLKSLTVYRCWGDFTADEIFASFPNLEVLNLWQLLPAKCQTPNQKQTTEPASYTVLKATTMSTRPTLWKLSIYGATLFSARGVSTYACEVTHLYLDHCYLNARRDFHGTSLKEIFPKLKRLAIFEKLCEGGYAFSNVINHVLEIETLEWLRVGGMKWCYDDSCFEEGRRKEDVKLNHFIKQCSISDDHGIPDFPTSFLLEKEMKGGSVTWNLTLESELDKESPDIDGGGWTSMDEQEFELYDLKSFYENYETYEDYFLQEEDGFPKMIKWC